MKNILLIATMISSSIFANAQNDTSKTVRLKTFEVYKTEMGNKLHWTVSCFISFAVFEIQRSTDAVNYTTINTFQADEAGNCPMKFVAHFCFIYFKCF